jgi:hypothetical protein
LAQPADQLGQNASQFVLLGLADYRNSSHAVSVYFTGVRRKVSDV